MRLLLSWLISAVTIFVIPYFISSIHIKGFLTAAIAAVVFGLINYLIKPIVSFFSLPITILTLGLFHLVINGLMFLLAAYCTTKYVAPYFATYGGVGFEVDGMIAAFLGALLYSVITWALSTLLIRK